MEPHTLQDYKVLVRELNLKILKVEKTNRDLEERLLRDDGNLTSDKKTVDIENAVIMNNKTVKIASRWKGAHQRNMFRQLVRKIARTDFLSHKQITANPNLNVALIILTAAQKRGLNFEMMFRMCDTSNKGEIKIQELGTLLKKLELERVSLAQINRFLSVLDENCTGYVKKEDFHNYLRENNVVSEIKRGSSSVNTNNTFERASFCKFALVLRARSIRPQEVCSFCDLNRTGYVSVPQLMKFIRNLSAPFKDQEIEGIIGYLTRGNKNQKISQNYFIQELDQAMATPVLQKKGQAFLGNKSPNQYDVDEDDEFDGDQQKPTRKQVDPFSGKSKYSDYNESSPEPRQKAGNTNSESKKGLESFSAKKNAFANNKENQRTTTPPKKATSALKERKRDLQIYSEEELRNFRRIIEKMEKKAKPIYQFLERLLLNVRDPAVGMTEQDFLRQLDKDYGEVLNREERQCLLKGMDQDASGTIDIFEVKRFFLSVTKQLQEKIVSTRLLLITMARSIEAERISTEEFVKRQGLNRNQICTLQDFHQKINSIFQFEEGEVNVLFMELDRKTIGTVEVSYFIETVDSFRGDQVPVVRSLAKTSDNLSSELLMRTKESKETVKQQKSPAKNPEIPTAIGLERKKREYQEPKEPKDETKLFKRAIVKMEIEGRPIYQLLQAMLDDMSDPNHGLDKSEVEDIFQRELNGMLSDKEMEALVDKLDNKGDGIVAIDEVVIFLNANTHLTKEKMMSKELMLMLLAKMAQAEDIKTEELLRQLGIALNKRTTIIEFKTRLAQILKVPKRHEDEIYKSFDYNSSGFISLAELIKGIDSYRVHLLNYQSPKKQVNSSSPLPPQEKKSTSPIPIPVSILERTPKDDTREEPLKKTFVVDPEKEKLAKEARKNDDEMLEIFNKMVRSIKMEPLEFFDTAAEGDLECTSHAFRNTFTKSNLKATPQDLSSLIRLLDINNKGVIHLRDFEMVTMDNEAFEFLKQVEWEYEGEDDDVDQEVVRKVKEALKDLKIEYIQFFKDCDQQGKKKISILDLKEGIRKTFPFSRISHKDSIKFMRSLDRNCTGMITEDEYISIMYKPEPPKNITRLIKDQSDPRAEIMNAPKLHSVAGRGKEGNNDLRDAIQMLKSIIYNPHIFSKPEGLFEKFDLNQDKILSREEFLKALDSIDSKANLSQRQKILLVTLADKYKNNKIEYEEFLKFMNQMSLGSRQIPDKRPLAQTRYPASGITSPTKYY